MDRTEPSGDDALALAARALGRFDPLAALAQIALRDDALALALRGVALAQLGEYARARRLLDRAARAFEATDPPRRARCLAALGEVALAQRDLAAAGRALEASAAALDAQGDRANGLFVRLQLVRRLVLLGRIDAAAAALGRLELRTAPPRLRAIADLLRTDIEARRLRPRSARASLARAREAAREEGTPALIEEVERAARDVEAPLARLVRDGVERPVGLDAVAALRRSRDLVVDACRREVRVDDVVVTLVKRPVLLALAVALAKASPGAATRHALAAEGFGARRVTESVRARLRVEIGRLRQALATLADLAATGDGYALRARRGGCAVLLPPAPGEASAILALLRGGESWSTSALATAVGSAQRTVQRALVALRDEGRVVAVGRGRAQRWIARPAEGFATNLLLALRPPSA